MNVAHLINILAFPTRVCQELRRQPRWGAAVIVITALTLLTTLFMHPFTRQAVFVSLVGKIDRDQIERALVASESMRYIGLILTPIPLFLRWLLVSTLLYVAAILLDAPTLEFKPLFAVTVHAESILVLMGILNVLLLYVHGMESIRHPIDLHAIAGLDIFMRCRYSDAPLFVLLNNANAFSIWYIVVLTIGSSVVTHLSAFKTALVVTGVWLLGVCLQVAVALVSSRLESAVAG